MILLLFTRSLFSPLVTGAAKTPGKASIPKPAGKAASNKPRGR